MQEFLKRLEYNLKCLFYVDGSWCMSGHLIGSAFPMMGFWINENGAYKTYKEMENAKGD